jgi:excisionase family DNA binding protein
MAIAVEAPRAPEAGAPRAYYSVSEAASVLGVSRVTVWRWIKAGRLAPARLGHRTVRISRDDMLRLLRPVPTHVTSDLNIVDPSERGHFVLFYEADPYLVKSVAEFLAPGLAHGKPGLVVATPEHRPGIAEQLAKSGIDVAAARRDGRLVELDAAETLERLMIDERQSAARFVSVVGSLVADLGPATRIYGEMVALLVARGNPEGALILEGLWNALQRKHSFGLLCGYPMEQLAGEELAGVLDGACEAHTTVVPTETYAELASTDARMREIVALQQKAASLERALDAERAALDQAQAALRIRDEFISIASHELRTPISVLTAQAQLSLRRLERQGQLEPHRVADALQLVGSQADKLARLVGQLLDVSRLDAGKLVLEPAEVDLARLIDQVVSTTRPLTDAHTISLNAPTSLLCKLDPLRIEQVLSNLLDNAIKYSPDGGAIDVSVTSSAEWVELAVRDHGLGIPESKRAQIFECFYQAHDNGQRGMGLGLYVSRHIVELHGGEMWPEFPPDGGTRMMVRMPVAVSVARSREPAMQLASD